MLRKSAAAELKEAEAAAERFRGVSDSQTARPTSSPLTYAIPVASGFRAFSGLGLAAGSAFTFSLANAVIKLLTGMPVWQIGFFQLALLFVFGYVSHFFGSFGDPSKNDYENPFGKRVLKRSGWKLTIRGFAGAIGLILRAAAVQMLPIGDAAAIINTSPVFVTIFAWAWLRERVNFTTLMCIVLTITGGVLIAKPTVFFGSPALDDFSTVAAWTPLVAEPSTSQFSPNDDNFARRPILNGKTNTNLTLTDYNQLKLDAALDRHPMAMATDFERPLNTLFTMFEQQQQVGGADDEDDIADVHGAIQYRDNSAAMTPRLNNDPLRTVEDIRAAYSANNTVDDDQDFREMPELAGGFAANAQRNRPAVVRYYNSQNRTAGILVALASSLVSAAILICVRTMRNENPNVIVMYSGLSGAVFCLVVSLISGSGWIAIGGVDHLWLPLLAVGGLWFISQFAVTRALRTDNANAVSLVRASEVLWGYIWQIFIFRDTPDLTSLLGAVMILGSIILLTLDRVDQQLSSSRRHAAALDESSNLLPTYGNNVGSRTETRVKTTGVWQQYPAPPPPYDAAESYYEMGPRADAGQPYRRPVALFAPYQRSIGNDNYEPI